MGIKKQEFYEGAAIHQLICGSDEVENISYSRPYFVINNSIRIYLKYSTAKRSPWGFAFTPEEQKILDRDAKTMRLYIGLICGADGIAALPYEKYIEVAQIKEQAIRVSCRRNHREHFEIRGASGSLSSRIAPSEWNKLVQNLEK